MLLDPHVCFVLDVVATSTQDPGTFIHLYGIRLKYNVRQPKNPIYYTGTYYVIQASTNMPINCIVAMKKT